MLSAFLGVHGYFKLSVEYPVCTKIASNALETCQWYEIKGQYIGSKKGLEKKFFVFSHNLLQTENIWHLKLHYMQKCICQNSKSTIDISVNQKSTITLRADIKSTKTISVNIKSFHTQHPSTTVFLYQILVEHGSFRNSTSQLGQLDY